MISNRFRCDPFAQPTSPVGQRRSTLLFVAVVVCTLNGGGNCMAQYSPPAQIPDTLSAPHGNQLPGFPFPDNYPNWQPQTPSGNGIPGVQFAWPRHPQHYPQGGIAFPVGGPYGYGGQYSLPYDSGTQSRTSFRYVDMSDAGFQVDPLGRQTISPIEDAISTPSSGFIGRAREAFASGNYAEAQRWISHAILEHPQDGPLHLWASQCWLAQGDYDMAVRELEPALEALPPSEWLANLRQLKLAYGQTSDAYAFQMRQLMEFNKEHPQSPGPHELLAFHGMDSENRNASWSHAAQAVQLDSTSTLARRLSENVRGPDEGGDRTHLPSIPPPPTPAELELLPQP